MANSPNGGLINETNQQYYVGTQNNIVSYSTDPTSMHYDSYCLM